MEGKKFYKSKTVWLNVLALVGIFLSSYFDITLTSEQTGAILVVVNLILRVVTKQALEV